MLHDRTRATSIRVVARSDVTHTVSVISARSGHFGKTFMFKLSDFGLKSDLLTFEVSYNTNVSLRAVQ